ncbi:S8 family serine peptidase [Actinomadura roseirufa]|uniref:S8 family serine peptidase n=1 Tax=Actinomadura roseirufa TaxID=2094049 RepID=UPI0013F1559A|nr:S8 family serine peptidase [Actinomadura roseirufa]
MSIEHRRDTTARVRAVSAATAAFLLLVLTASPAAALPRPRAEEWWFATWRITDGVWPTARGQGVTVAVVDGGVEAHLPDLQGVVLDGAGWDAPGDHHADEGRADEGHGTAMAGLIAAQGRGSGMVGVAPEAKILPLRAGATGLGPALRYAADHGAKVISISRAGPGACPAALQKDVTYAVRKDAIVVAGPGGGTGDDDLRWPANCAGVLAVGAVDHRSGVWPGTSPGTNVMAAAPGPGVSSVRGNGTIGAPGEASAATALASGAVALVRSRFPRMSGRQIVQRLLATAKDVGPAGWDKRTGNGLLAPHQAITSNVPADAPNPTYERLDRLESGGYSAPKALATRPQAHTPKNESSAFPLLSATLGLIAVLTVAALFILRNRAANR